MFSSTLISYAGKLLNLCQKQGLKIATAESCTGGLIAGLLTEIPGSSAVFDRGFITYSNEAKSALLGVAAALIERHGAVSAQVAEAMAKGALDNSNADIAVSVTGIAGPGGGTKTKPVGLVYIGLASHNAKTFAEEYWFQGSRTRIRMFAVKKGLLLIKGSI